MYYLQECLVTYKGGKVVNLLRELPIEVRNDIELQKEYKKSMLKLLNDSTLKRAKIPFYDGVKEIRISIDIIDDVHYCFYNEASE